MNPEITMEQQAQLNTWASQRDAILLEISGLENIKGVLLKTNREIAESNKDIADRENVIRGRIEELKINELELPKLLRKEILPLEKEKTLLESKVTSLQKEASLLEEQKMSLRKDIVASLEIFDSLHEKSGTLEKVIGCAVKVSEQNEKDIKKLVDGIISGMEELVSKNNEAILTTNNVIEQLPKVFLEVQRKSLIRNVINPKKI